MNLTVFGPTGGTGLQVVKKALEQEHTVTAFVRDPAHLPLKDDALRLVTGDALDPAAVVGAVMGQDATIVALGSHDRKNRTIRSEGTANVIRAMETHNVARLVVVSAGGVGDSYHKAPLILKFLIKTLLRNTYADHEQQEKYVRNSNLDWIIVRPSMLTDGPVSGQYSTGLADADLPGGQVSRADVAHFVLQQLREDRYLRQAVSIT